MPGQCLASVMCWLPPPSGCYFNYVVDDTKGGREWGCRWALCGTGVGDDSDEDVGSLGCPWGLPGVV